jgi:hypothetical protein
MQIDARAEIATFHPRAEREQELLTDCIAFPPPRLAAPPPQAGQS